MEKVYFYSTIRLKLISGVENNNVVILFNSNKQNNDILYHYIYLCIRWFINIKRSYIYNDD